MTRTIHLTTEEGRTVTCDFNQIRGISQSFIFYDLDQPDDVDYWRSFFEDYATNITTHLLHHAVQISLRVSCTGQYEQFDNGRISDPIAMNTAFPARINRHANYESKIRNQFLAVHDPNEYHMRLQEQFGSNIGLLQVYHSFSLTFEFPYEYNARSLQANYRLHKCDLTNFLHYNPRNTDPYCVLHCLFAGKDQLHAGKALNSNVTYMKEFNKWFQKHNLGRFYIDGFFVLDNVEKLEKELGININFYTFEDKLELFYRSSYCHEGDIFNLVVIPMKYFYDNNKKAVPEIPQQTPDLIHPLTDLDEEFIAAISVKNLITKRDGHCAMIDPAIFRPRKPSGEINYNTDVCRYCTGNFSQHKITLHETACKLVFQESKRGERIRNYQELPAKKVVKGFTNYVAQYQIPFCVYDFETRLSPEGRHIGFSYAMIYINIFDFSKSRISIKASQDVNELLEWFLDDVIDFVAHHHKLQSVDYADPEERDEAEIPEDGKCPFCLEEVEDKKWDYNHSHFRGDNKNKHLDRYICHSCNAACTIKNKPLKFYGHNASRFDNYLFLESLVNSPKFTNFEFLAKTESRFTQVVCAVNGNTKHTVSFNDSRMIVSGGLASLAKAWITPGVDDPKLAALLKLFYPSLGETQINTLVGISREKAVFPYAALNKEELLESKKPISRKHFYDTLYNTEISDEDYETYLKANSILKKTLGKPDYCFLDYHNLYLGLDCILLGLVLSNFFEINTKTSGINPLWSLSVSSFSFSSLLFHNKYSENPIPQIKIPKVQVQKYLQKSIRGGFSQIFHKQLQNPEDKATSLAFYVDFNSMYPSAMATKKLPYEFTRWVPTEGISVTELLEQLEEAGDSKYFFMEVDIAPLAEARQDKVSRYPLFPENREIQPEWLSADQKYRWKVNSGHDFEPTTINCVTFFEKKNYICSYSYLKMAIAAGYQVTRVHNVAEFNADFVMADYVKKIYGDKRNGSIEKNNLIKTMKEHGETPELKAQLANVECRIACAKIKANGLYGATIINQDRHSETEIVDVTNTKILKKRISSLRFKSLYQADQKVLVNMDKNVYNLSYPLSLGSAILWESKVMMGTFVYALYDYLRSLRLEMFSLMTDTDSFCCQVPKFTTVFSSFDEFSMRFNTDCYRVFDTSFNKPEFQDPTTHEELCFMKNETKNVPITEFNGICSKVYSYEKAASTVVKGKGVAETLQRKHLTNDLYRNVINGIGLEDPHTCEFGSFSAKKLKVNVVRVAKKYVTLVDIKSWYGENGTKPLVFGSAAHLATLPDF